MGVAPSVSTEDVEMQENGASETTLPAEVLSKIDETHAALSAKRKKRKAPEGYATADEVKTYTQKHVVPSLHSPSPSGITALAVSSLNPSQFLTGGNDKVVQLYDRSTDKVVVSLKGHTKKITQVAFREREGEPTLLMSASADKVAKIWAHDTASDDYIPKSTIRTHKGEVTSLAVHPSSAIVALSSLDKTYSLHDLSSFQQVFRSAPHEEGFTSLAIHPDGTLIGLGTPASTMQIYDVRSGGVAASLTPPEGVPFTVNTLSFSENGYNLLAPSSLSTVAIWDLRKLKISNTIDLGDSFKVNAVSYDYSAQYLGVAGNEGIKLFAHKTWEPLASFQEGEVSALVFGEQGKEIWGASGREIRIWGVAA
jgi:pre-mRNA-processing factor 19